MPSPDLVQSGADFVVGVKRSTFTGSAGIPNPFGDGASAYEPHTQIYDPSNDPLMAGSRKQVLGQSQSEKDAADKLAADQAAGAATTVNTGGAGAPVANGSVLSFINAAKQMLGKPYVWGGTTIRGTDCSGLLYFAFNAAGIKMPRYVASQYGKMGQQVDAGAARAGDIVYWDEPGAVDHVGIYLGNGMVLNSPTTGQVTRIQKVWGNPVYRRIIQDDQFGTMVAGPNGMTTASYGGQPATSVFNTNTVRGVASVPIPASVVPSGRTPDSGFKIRAI